MLWSKPTGDDQQSARPGAPRRASRVTRFRQRMGIHIYVLPNLITTVNMFFGFFAIVYAIKGEFVTAAYAIVASAIFDLLDGRVARITHSTSEFGAQYDSLTDIISFGAAPGVLLFLWSLQPFGRLGWLAAFFYVACGALRLARFNVSREVIEPGYFQGLPIPMAAGIVASSVLAFTDQKLEASKSIWLLLMTFLLGFVMVSNFRYRSFKDLDLKQRLPFTYLVAGVFILSVIAIHPEVTLFALFMVYALLGAIFGVLRLGRPLRMKAAMAHERNVIVEDDLHEPIDPMEDDEDSGDGSGSVQ